MNTSTIKFLYPNLSASDLCKKVNVNIVNKNIFFMYMNITDNINRKTNYIKNQWEKYPCTYVNQKANNNYFL